MFYTQRFCREPDPSNFGISWTTAVQFTISGMQRSNLTKFQFYRVVDYEAKRLFNATMHVSPTGMQEGWSSFRERISTAGSPGRLLQCLWEWISKVDFLPSLETATALSMRSRKPETGLHSTLLGHAEPEKISISFPQFWDWNNGVGAVWGCHRRLLHLPRWPESTVHSPTVLPTNGQQVKKNSHLYYFLWYSLVKANGVDTLDRGCSPF